MRVSGGFVIGADTIVWGDGWKLGKPRDRSDARGMLSFLSGKTHRVTTGYAVIRAATRTLKSGQVTARVTMRKLLPSEIDAYVASGEADDKAGAYAIQGGAAGFVSRVEGGRDTVVGLPVQDVIDMLRDMGYGPPIHAIS
jgi:septum formation protein